MQTAGDRAIRKLITALWKERDRIVDQIAALSKLAGPAPRRRRRRRLRKARKPQVAKGKAQA